jgi:hypothetical protein
VTDVDYFRHSFVSALVVLTPECVRVHIPRRAVESYPAFVGGPQSHSRSCPVTGKDRTHCSFNESSQRRDCPPIHPLHRQRVIGDHDVIDTQRMLTGIGHTCPAIPVQ